MTLLLPSKKDAPPNHHPNSYLRQSGHFPVFKEESLGCEESLPYMVSGAERPLL